MAFENLARSVTLEAGADLSSNQYRFVKLSSGQVVLNGDGEDALGVLQNDDASAAGEEAEVALIGEGGITKIVVGGAVSQDGDVASDANGRAVAPSTGDAVLGQALEAATTAGEIISMVLQRKAATA